MLVFLKAMKNYFCEKKNPVSIDNLAEGSYGGDGFGNFSIRFGVFSIFFKTPVIMLCLLIECYLSPKKFCHNREKARQ
mgnify:CR=1 FL=1